MRVFVIIPFGFLVYCTWKYLIMWGLADRESEEAQKGWLFALFGWAMYFISCLESWK